ncbi:MAG TPA: alanine racemase [Acidimicrobiia bacterium]|nr:alanine racemase [Acidimicrobiia bacterium]
MRPTYAEIDLGAIRSNVMAFAELISPAQVCAVVKADGYGHGDVPVAGAAVDAGATRLAVALVEEGIRLREAGISAPILVLSEPTPDSAVDVAAWELQPTVYSTSFLEALEATRVPMEVHLKVDTGMHRVGASPSQVAGLAEKVDESRTLDLASVWTHFSVADEDPAFTEVQIERFDEATAGIALPMSHLANTAGAVLFPEARRDLCRVGIGLYGLHPCAETRDRIELTPAMRVVSHVSHVQRLGPGERPSYGRVRETSRDATVVTIPIGYADGFWRGLTGHGQVLIGGEGHILAGTVTMDQIVVDVGDLDVAVGDEAVLLGSQGEVEVTADDWAAQLDTISYEVVCSIGPRVPRRYL